MPFEFAFLDWLYQFRNPVMNTISIFFDYAGAHGEIWIAFTLLLLLFRRTRKAGFAMAVALVLYMAAGHFFLKPLFARPRPAISTPPSPCWWRDRTGIPSPPGTPLPGWRQPMRSGYKTGSWARPRWCWQFLSPLPGCTSMCTSPPMSLAARCWASHWAQRPPHLQTIWRIAKINNKLYKKRSLHKCVQRPFFSIILPGAALSGSVPGPSTPVPTDCPQAGRRPALPPASSA